ncbi:hypothetical protein [Thermus tengchongensis]|uniref:hypothetical protein n=1 Tax=Thermus tengchongensis TaxID=1214928 RepID=UPI000570B3A4|nr:hypothetical protein [Thermus tengchongensis]
MALPSGREVFRTTSLQVKRYWDTGGFGGTTALRLEVDYTGEKTGTAYALLALQVQGTGLSGQNLQAQGLMEDLDGFIAQACRFIGFYELSSVRWLCTAHRTMKKAINYWNQLGDMWEDFKNQAIYYGTGLALDWLGKGLGLHQLNPLVDQVDQALTDLMSDIRRQKNAILNALARARAEQLRELDAWKPGDDPLYWGPEWWTRLISGVVPQLGFQATTQSLADLQRTAQLLENQSRVAQNVKNQQENLSLESTLQDLWDTLGAAWNFIAEAVSKGWASLTGGFPGRAWWGRKALPREAPLGPRTPRGLRGHLRLGRHQRLRLGGRDGPRHHGGAHLRGPDRPLHPGGDGGGGEGLRRAHPPAGPGLFPGRAGDEEPRRPAGHDRGATGPGEPELGGAHQEAGA